MLRKKYTQYLKMKVVKKIITRTRTLFQATICPCKQYPSAQNLSDTYQPRINENELFSLFTADVSGKNLVYFR